MAGDVLTWWLAAQLIGLVGLPLAARLLGSLPDSGYSLAKPLGLLLSGYLAWLLAMFGLAPFAAPVIGVSALAVAAAGVWASGGPRAALGAARAGLAHKWPRLLASEALFLGALLAAVWMRAHDPTPFGTERPMDFAFFNAVQRSGLFPPQDPWLSGFSINYYYFGYLLMGAMALLTGSDPAAAYNLALALTFAMTAQGVAGLIWNLMVIAERSREFGDGVAPPSGVAPGGQPAPRLLSRASRIFFPLLGVLFVLVAGNQSGALQVVLGDERVVALDGPQLASALGQALKGAERISLPYPAPTVDFGSVEGWERRPGIEGFSWWWPSRSLWDEYTLEEPGLPARQQRIYNITEFPLFSFRLGDMHPHVMALPFGLLAAGLAFATLARSEPPPLAGRRGPAELVLGGLILGSLYAINSWDLPTYVLLYSTALGLLVFRSGVARPWLETGKRLAVVLVASYLLYLPFHLTFRSLVGAAAPLIDLPLIGRLTSVLAPYLQGRSGLHAFLIIFGLFAVPIVAFVYLAGRRRDRAPQTSVPGPVLGIVAGSDLAERGPPAAGHPPLPVASGWLPWLPPALLIVGLLVGFPLLALAGLGALALQRAWQLRDRPAEGFALLLAALGCAVLFGTEIVYIRDVFGNRMNTIFKFYYQIWLLWGTLAPFALWWALRSTRGADRAVAAGVALVTLALFAGALAYPWITLRELGRGPVTDLQGRTPREQTVAGEDSIDWLRRHVAPGSVVLEAVDVENPEAVAAGARPVCGGSYDVRSQGFGGVSSATGLPTVLGWKGHELQWRGGDPEALAQLDARCADVDTIYRTTDLDLARDLLARYGVRYVYIGGLERSLYPPESLAKFAQLGTPVFEQDEVTILQRP
ncbi:MAG: DUF2298 domain-containing protein [Chloroflexi bacterium OHK40]